MTCIIFFAKDLEVNEYFKIKILNDLKARCFKRAKEIKSKLGSDTNQRRISEYNNSNQFIPSSANLNGGSSDIRSKYFSLTHEDVNGKNSEFSVNFEKIIQFKINHGKSNEVNKVKKKKDFGQLWYKNEKNINIQIGMISKDLRNARTCAYNKNPELTYKMLCDLYNRVTSKIK